MAVAGYPCHQRAISPLGPGSRGALPRRRRRRCQLPRGPQRFSTPPVWPSESTL